MPLADQLPLLAFALQQDLSWNTFFASKIGPSPAAARSPAIMESDFIDMRIVVQGPRARRPTFPPVERHRTASIVLTICASCTLIITTMIWQRHAGTISRQEPPFMPRGPALAATTSPAAAAPMTPPTAPTALPVKPNAIAPHESTGRMPVAVYFHRRGVHDDPSDRRKVDWLMEGRLTNLSDQPLNVEVRVESANAQGASLAQIGIDPHGQRDFGADDGLRIHAGDKITLVSAPYADFIAAGAN